MPTELKAPTEFSGGANWGCILFLLIDLVVVIGSLYIVFLLW